MSFSRAVVPAMLLLFLPWLTGCGTLPNGRGWGQDATLWPGGERLREAFVGALMDPLTWGPAAAGLALQIDDVDSQISDWAGEHTPVFGSVESAKEARNYIGNASDGIYFATALATPGGGDAATWAWSKTKGIGLGLGTWFLGYTATDALKEEVGRTRPDESNDKSFPSEHGVRVGMNSTLSSRNLRAMDLSDGARVAGNAGLVSLAALGGWSRVEAEAHFPSDVLAGMAMGHFLAAFINDAFMGLDSEIWSVQAAPFADGLQAQISYRF